MAKVVISADSATKECVLTVDGQVIGGIRDIYFSSYYSHGIDKYISLSVQQEIKDPSGLFKKQDLSLSIAGLEPINQKEVMKRIK